MFTNIRMARDARIHTASIYEAVKFFSFKSKREIATMKEEGFKRAPARPEIFRLRQTGAFMKAGTGKP